MDTILRIEGRAYLALEDVREAFEAGTLGALLEQADSKSMAPVVSPVVEARPVSLYDIPKTFREGSSVTLRVVGGATRRGRVCQSIRQRRAVSEIRWGNGEHSELGAFLANMEAVNAVYDGLSTFTVY